MLYIFFSLVLFISALTGVGALFAKSMGVFPLRNPWLCPWLGFIITTTVVNVVSFFMPVSEVLLLIFLTMGLVGVRLFYVEYVDSFCKKDLLRVKFFVCAALGFVMFLSAAYSFSDWSRGYDTALYHANVVRWLNEYGIVKGLGNLHPRLAFNSIWLSFAALLDNGFWNDASSWVMPGLLVLLAFLYFIHEILFSRKRRVAIFAGVCLLWLGLLTLVGVFLTKASLYYDDACLLLNAILLLETYYLVSRQSKNLARDLFLIVTLATATFLIKPMGAVSVVFAWLISFCYFVKLPQRSAITLSKIYGFSVLAGVVWIAKNVMSSGYILFPTPLLALNLDWTMTVESVRDNYEAIIGWARMPGQQYRLSVQRGLGFWFGEWLRNNLSAKAFWFYVGLPLLGSIIVWIKVFMEERRSIAILFFSWSTLSLCYWFATAPDARFAHGFAWTSLGLALMFVSRSDCDFTPYISEAILRRAKFALAILGVSCVLFTAISDGRNCFRVGTMPSFPVKQYRVGEKYQFTVWIPAGNTDRCGNAELPCAPYYPELLDNLEMRSPGDIGQGFYPRMR